jgi:integrase
MRITKTWLSNYVGSNNKAKTIPEKDMFYRSEGIGVKVAAKTGTLTFFVEGRIKGSSNKRVSLGQYPLVSLDEAKNKAHEIKKLLTEGKDPRKENESIKETNRKAQAHTGLMELKLSDLIDRYCDLRSSKTGKDYRYILNLVFAEFINKPVRSIKPEDIARRFNEYKDRKATAQKAMRYLRAIFTHGTKIEVDGEILLTKNAVSTAETMLPKDDTRPVPPRDSFIPQERIFDFVRGLITECQPSARDCTLLQLLTGLRDSEAKQLKWANIDFDKMTFTATDTKNRKDHTLPMSSLTYAMLLSRRQDINPDKKITNDTWVFPARGNKSHLGDIRKQLVKVIRKTGIEFIPHDLRRTFATLLEGELKLNTGVISRFLNHAPANVTEKHYMKAKASNLSGEANTLALFISSLGDYTSDNGVGQWTSPHEHSIEKALYTNMLNESKNNTIDWSYILYQVQGNLSPEELDKILSTRTT